MVEQSFDAAQDTRGDAVSLGQMQEIRPGGMFYADRDVGALRA